MPPAARIAVLAVTFALLVVGFVVASPDDDANDQSLPQTSASAERPATTTAETTAGSSRSATRAPRPKPKFERIVVRGLEPRGGVQKITVKKGATTRFIVASDKPDAVHLHGYDIEMPVGPGRPARFVFKAKLDGIFELELEHAGVPVGELRVEP